MTRPEPSHPPGLLVEALHRGWRGAPVLRGVDLRVEPGELVAVLGDNGTGKTTLLRVLAGLLAPEAGRVRLLGIDIEQAPRRYRAGVGLLSAGDRTLYARLTVAQNLEFCARLAALRRGERQDAVARLLSSFGLEHLATRRADRLSLGQRQRTRLAAAFVPEPAMLLLDEPTSSLDRDGRGLLAAALRAHVASGGMAVWSAPEDSDALPSDRRFALCDGGLGPA